MDGSNHIYSRRLDTKHVVLSRRKAARSLSPLTRRSAIIRRAQVNFHQERRHIVGGDPADTHAQDTPAIVIEEEHGQLVKIIVTCPCGRHAEVECEHES